MGSVSADSEESQKAILEQALFTIWPNELRTLFLRACVVDGIGAKKSWQQFALITGDPKSFIERDMTGFKGPLPLMHSAARRNDFTLDTGLWTYLRSATFREELRYRAYRDICGRVLGAFVDAKVPVAALKACAFAETLYETPGERHCHAIDLLVPAEALSEASRIVLPLGFRPARLAEARPGGRCGFRHESGLPLVVHSTLFDPPIYRLDMNVVWAASLPATIAGVRVNILSPIHNLLHVLGDAFHDHRRDNIRWVSDASRLINGRSDKDWDELVRLTKESGLNIPIATILKIMSGPMEAPVPSEVLSSLVESTNHCSGPAVEAAISAAVGGLSDFKAIWFQQPARPQVRRTVLRFLLRPSAQYLQWRFGTESRLFLFFGGFLRPLAYVTGRLWGRALRLPGLNRFTRYHRIAAELKKLRT